MILWFTIPPLISLPIALILVAFGNQSYKVSAGAPLWVLLLLLYFALSMLYVFSIRNEVYSHLTPLQMATQGIIVCLVSMEAGAPSIIPWVGIIVAASGFFILIQSFQQAHAEVSPAAAQRAELAPTEEPSEALDTSPFPSVVTDNEGTVVVANEAFKTLVENSPAEGENVTSFFTPGESEGIIGGKKHAIFQKMKDELFHFILVDASSVPKSAKTAETKTDFELFDPKTRLYSRKYAALRIPEELSRANRYRRWLCGILLKMDFTYLPGKSSQPALEETFLAAYAQYAREAIRESDMGFFFGENEILLLLPETPQQGAKETALKLSELSESLNDMKKEYPFSVEIEYGFLYYSGNYPLAYEQFIQKLYSSLGGGAE